jgi:hypothetical protein
MLTHDQRCELDERGLVTIDPGFSVELVAEASAALARLVPRQGDEPRRHRGNDCPEPSLDWLILDPAVTEAAASALCAETAVYYEAVLVRVFPCPGPFSFWEHIDARYESSRFAAAPRRLGVVVILWLEDVDRDTGPMMVRPGSHRLLAEHWERHPPTSLQGCPFAELPPLRYAEPEPILARRGQATVAFTSAVHGGSIAVGARDRRSVHIGFTPPGLDLGLDRNEARLRYISGLEARRRARSGIAAASTA